MTALILFTIFNACALVFTTWLYVEAWKVQEQTDLLLEQVEQQQVEVERLLDRNGHG